MVSSGYQFIPVMDMPAVIDDSPLTNPYELDIERTDGCPPTFKRYVR